MNFFKRALTSLIKQVGKTVILFLLVFILATAIVGAISVRDAINNTDTNLRHNMRPIVTIHHDFISFNEYLMEWQENVGFNWNRFDPDSIDINDPSTFPPRPSVQNLTTSDIRAIGALEGVKDFAYTIVETLFSFDLHPMEIISIVVLGTMTCDGLT